MEDNSMRSIDCTYSSFPHIHYWLRVSIYFSHGTCRCTRPEGMPVPCCSLPQPRTRSYQIPCIRGHYSLTHNREGQARHVHQDLDSLSTTLHFDPTPTPAA